MFIVSVVMMNILIAIVSDSYEHAMIRAERLFLRARLEIAAELDSLFALTRGVNNNTGCTRLSRSSCCQTILKTMTSPFIRVFAMKSRAGVVELETEMWTARAQDMENRMRTAVTQTEKRLERTISRMQKQLQQQVTQSEIRLVKTFGAETAGNFFGTEEQDSGSRMSHASHEEKHVARVGQRPPLRPTVDRARTGRPPVTRQSSGRNVGPQGKVLNRGRSSSNVARESRGSDYYTRTADIRDRAATRLNRPPPHPTKP